MNHKNTAKDNSVMLNSDLQHIIMHGQTNKTKQKNQLYESDILYKYKNRDRLRKKKKI